MAKTVRGKTTHSSKQGVKHEGSQPVIPYAMESRKETRSKTVEQTVAVYERCFDSEADFTLFVKQNPRVFFGAVLEEGTQTVNGVKPTFEVDASKGLDGDDPLFLTIRMVVAVGEPVKVTK